MMRKALIEYLRAFSSHFTQTHLYLVCAFVSRFGVLSLLFPYYVFTHATLRFLSLYYYYYYFHACICFHLCMRVFDCALISLCMYVFDCAFIIYIACKLYF